MTPGPLSASFRVAVVGAGREMLSLESCKQLGPGTHGIYARRVGKEEEPAMGMRTTPGEKGTGRTAQALPSEAKSA